MEVGDTEAAVLVERFELHAHELNGHEINNHRLLVAIQPAVPKMMASLAKIMTVMLVWDKVMQDNIDPSRTLVDMPVDLLRGSSQYYQFYHKGDSIPLSTLIKSALIASSNEAAFALACWHSGDERRFVSQMARKSDMLSLTGSHWSSASGLDRRAYTTAQDMSRLAKVFISQYAVIATYCRSKDFKFNGKKVFNTNRLMHSYANIKGLKTGTLVGIGSNLINYWVNEDIHYLSIVLGAESRNICYELSQDIMNDCF